MRTDNRKLVSLINDGQGKSLASTWAWERKATQERRAGSTESQKNKLNHPEIQTTCVSAKLFALALGADGFCLMMQRDTGQV